MKEFWNNRMKEFEPSYFGWILFGLIGGGALIYFVNLYPTQTIIIYSMILFVLQTKFLEDEDNKDN